MISAPALAGFAAANSRVGGRFETKPNRPRTGEGAFLCAIRKLNRVLQLEREKVVRKTKLKLRMLRCIVFGYEGGKNTRAAAVANCRDAQRTDIIP